MNGILGLFLVLIGTALYTYVQMQAPAVPLLPKEIIIEEELLPTDSDSLLLTRLEEPNKDDNEFINEKEGGLVMEVEMIPADENKDIA